MKFRPLGDRVLIKRVAEETKSKGGIFIPETAQDKPQRGEVLAVGPGAKDDNGYYIKTELKEGDLILFGKWSGSEITVDGTEFLIMKESDVLGVIESKPSLKAVV